MTNDNNDISGGGRGDGDGSSQSPPISMAQVPASAPGGSGAAVAARVGEGVPETDGDVAGSTADERKDEAPGGTTTAAATTTTTIGSTTVTGLPLDWTQMGATADESMPLRYPHDVAEWSVEDLEISVVGTAGQKITVLGNDFDVTTATSTTTSKNKATIGNITNPDLQVLILRSHLIKEMKGLAGLTKLETLELYDNMVQSLDEDSLRGCGPSLKVLDMSYNSIRDMTPVSLCSPVNLTELYLANNKLKTISGLSGLTNLKKLDLGANRIRVMPPEELSGLVNLEELWIGKNKIEQIDGLQKVRLFLFLLSSRGARMTKRLFHAMNVSLTHPFISQCTCAPACVSQSKYIHS